jgi:hypothetical protein
VQIVDQLSFVHLCEPIESLAFHDQSTLHDQVGTILADNLLSISDVESHLRLRRESTMAQL